MLSESCIHIAASSLADMHSAIFHDVLQMYCIVVLDIVAIEYSVNLIIKPILNTSMFSSYLWLF